MSKANTYQLPSVYLEITFYISTWRCRFVSLWEMFYAIFMFGAFPPTFSKALKLRIGKIIF